MKKITSSMIALLCLSAPTLPCQAQSPRDRIMAKLGVLRADQSNETMIGETKVHYWLPARAEGQAPLVIFSHGFGGTPTQSKALAQALSDDGYIVVAPAHQDARNPQNPGKKRPEVPFDQPQNWTDDTYKNRARDISDLLKNLRQDPNWSSRIDWSKVALAGHSLGGYTVLGLAGARASWQIPGIKAVLALSPYSTPYLSTHGLAQIKIPVMYQGGTRDFGITPHLKGANGVYSQTHSPAYFVEFDQMGHMGWTNFNQNQEQVDAINYYATSFFDKYVKQSQSATPDKKLPGVVTFESK